MGKKYSVGEVAEELGYSTETIRRWLESGSLRGHRSGDRGHWRVTEENLQRFKDRWLDDSATAAS